VIYQAAASLRAKGIPHGGSRVSSSFYREEEYVLIYICIRGCFCHVNRVSTH